MDWKLVSAFAAGAVLASGIVYFSVQPRDLVTRPVVIQAAAPPAAPRIAVAPAPTHVPTPIPEKPSPMPHPVRRPRASVIARRSPPPSITPAEPPLPRPLENVPLENVSLPAPAPAPAPNVEPRVPHVVTLAAGMSLAVRIGETISSSRNQTGDSFLATLTQPLVIDGFIIAERGARLEGSVDAASAGRGTGVSRLSVSVVRLATADGQNIRIRTEPYTKDGPSPAGVAAAKVGGAGAGDVLLTRGKPVEIPVETRISFRVQDSVTITERLD